MSIKGDISLKQWCFESYESSTDWRYYATCLVCLALFASLVPAICNHKSCAQVYELPQSHCGNNREGTLFSWLRIHITLILLLWDLSTPCVVITNDHLYYEPYLACWALFGTLVPTICNHTSCAQVHGLCHKAIVLITERAHCFHDCTYISIYTCIYM